MLRIYAYQVCMHVAICSVSTTLHHALEPPAPVNDVLYSQDTNHLKNANERMELDGIRATYKSFD